MDGIITSKEVRELREGLGMTQAVFSKKVGVTIQTLSYWENGRRSICQQVSNHLKLIKKEGN